MAGSRPSQLLVPTLMLLAALIAFFGIAPPADWRALRSEPGVQVFSFVLVAIHVAPFLVVAALARRAVLRRRVVVVAVVACVAELALLAWAYSVLGDDAQAGLVYVFVTPLATWAIADVGILAMGSPKTRTRPG